MSTEYPIFNTPKGDLCALEHSSKLDLYILGVTKTHDIVEDLTPLQLAAIGIELIRVAEYQDDEVTTLLSQGRDKVYAEARKILGRE